MAAKSTFAIPESLLHFVWRTKQMQIQNLRTTDNTPLQILAFGQYNTDAGPDFFNGRAKIDDTEWVGNIEMHVKSSDWNLHGHSTDAAYDNVILHVVWHHDVEILRRDGTTIPTLVLADLVSPDIVHNFEQLSTASTWIPCEVHLADMPKDFIPLWIERLAVERLERKTAGFKILLEESNMDWEQAFFVGLAGTFGMKVNTDAFKNLASKLPFTLLLKYSDNLFQLEALLFGVAGYLNQNLCKSGYYHELGKEYTFLQAKHQLLQISLVSWKQARMRPFNLPTLRIAQLARLIHSKQRIFSTLLEKPIPATLSSLLDIAIEDGYWLDHYTFGKPSKPVKKRIGDQLKQTICINLVAPFLFLYGKVQDDDGYNEASIGLLESLPSEKNAIIDKWNSIGVGAHNAKETQALLQLKNEYCSHVRCLDCQIGFKILC